MVSFNEQDIERLKSIKEKTKRVKYTERSLELVLDYDLIRSFAKYSGVDLQDTSGADMENASQVILEKLLQNMEVVFLILDQLFIKTLFI